MFENVSFQDLFMFGQVFIFGGLFIWAFRIWYSEFVGASRVLRHFFVDRPRHRRGEKMVRIAKQKGTKLIFNSVGGVTAICTTEAFYRAKREWLAKIDAENDPKKKLEMSLTRPLFSVFPTFTFAEVEVSLTLHTGMKSDIEELLKTLVYSVTGEQEKRVSRKHYEQAVKCLVRQDARLHIPFTKDRFGNYQSAVEVKEFGQLTLEDAEKTLLL